MVAMNTNISNLLVSIRRLETEAFLFVKTFWCERCATIVVVLCWNGQYFVNRR